MKVDERKISSEVHNFVPKQCVVGREFHFFMKNFTLLAISFKP
jgi:hypothetical protein